MKSQSQKAQKKSGTKDLLMAAVSLALLMVIGAGGPFIDPWAAEASEKITMLKDRELSGQAFTSRSDLSLDITNLNSPIFESGPSQSSLHAASEIRNRLSAIEIFLKSGPAAGGDLSSISSGVAEDSP